MEDDLRARAVLAEMQMRISQGPYAALSVVESANAEQVRAAFLQLTKQFHPARFGRMSSDVQKLSNEVFLGIKSAHDALTKQLGSSGRPASAHTTGGVTTEIPRATGIAGGTQRGTGLVTRATTPPLARGTDRPGHRPSSPSIAEPPRPATTPGVGTRAPTPTPSTSQQITQVNARVGTPAPGALPRAATQTTNPAQRPGTPAPRPTSPISVARPGSPPLRPGSPPLPSSVIDPPTIRYSGVQPTQQLPRAQTPAFNEQAALKAAMDLLTSKDYAGARQAFHALAAKMPQTRRYRALLCYARGRETAASGRIDDAVLEFQRALQLDSDLEIAKQAIRELARKSPF